MPRCKPQNVVNFSCNGLCFIINKSKFNKNHQVLLRLFYQTIVFLHKSYCHPLQIQTKGCSSAYDV